MSMIPLSLGALGHEDPCRAPVERSANAQHGHDDPGSDDGRDGAPPPPRGGPTHRTSASVDRLDRQEDAELRVGLQVGHSGSRRAPAPETPAPRPPLCPVGAPRRRSGSSLRGRQPRRARRANAACGSNGAPALARAPGAARCAAVLSPRRLGPRPRARASWSRSTPRPGRAGTPPSRKLGSRSAASHSATATASRRWVRMSSRASSIQPRSRSHAPSSASWAISTVGSRVAGSRSNESNRRRPKASITSSIILRVDERLRAPSAGRGGGCPRSPRRG